MNFLELVDKFGSSCLHLAGHILLWFRFPTVTALKSRRERAASSHGSLLRPIVRVHLYLLGVGRDALLLFLSLIITLLITTWR